MRFRGNNTKRKRHALVMPGPVPGIYVKINRTKDVDGRNKSGHDAVSA
jgi:hypothetical protein